MGKKIKLSFVNEGKAFIIPHMTVKSQELLFSDMVKIEKKYKQESPEFLRELNKYMILRILKTVDDSVEMLNIENMHPDDFVELIKLVNEGGRELTSSDAGNFRKKKK